MQLPKEIMRFTQDESFRRRLSVSVYFCLRVLTHRRLSSRQGNTSKHDIHTHNAVNAVKALFREAETLCRIKVRKSYRHS